MRRLVAAALIAVPLCVLAGEAAPVPAKPAAKPAAKPFDPKAPHPGKPAGPPPAQPPPVKMAVDPAYVDANGNLTEPKRFTWDVPAEIQGIEVPTILEADGVPMKLHAVQSKWGVQQLAEYYGRRMEEAGLFIPPDRDKVQLIREPSLTGLDPARQISWTFIFQSNPDGTTTVIIGEAHLGDRRPMNGEYIAPLYPGAIRPIQSDVEGMKTLIYGTTAQEAEVLGYYQGALGKTGYAQVSQTPPVFRKGGSQLELKYRRDSSGASVMLIERRADTLVQPDPKTDPLPPQ